MMDWNKRTPTPRNRGAEAWLVGLTLVGGLTGLGQPALAQNLITPDASLGAEASVVTPFGPLDVITGGAQRGANLFHSFGEFNIGSGYGVTFLTPVGDVASIFARVTGPNPAQILGVLGTRQGNLTTPSTANLFLINPNGMVFGPGASLDMAGSFYATTADSIQFGSEGLFSALDPTTDNLLTINPSALWFSGLRPPAPIAIQGDPTIPLDLELAPGAGLSLIGGPVLIDGKWILAPGGRVDILALGQGGTIGLGSTGVVVPGALQRSDITLRNGAAIRTAAGGGGDITLYGRDLSLDQGSRLIAGIAAGLGTPAAQGGTIQIDSTGSLTVTNGTQLITSTLGTGNAGNIDIVARDQVVFDGGYAFSSVNSGTEGQGGNVQIATGSLTVANGAELSASTFGTGDAGNVDIIAHDQVVFNESAAFSNVEAGAEGQGGNVQITTGSLTVTNGAQLIANTFGTGSAGNVNIVARDQVVFDGVSADGQFNSAAFSTFSNVEAGAEGQGGNVQITTGSLTVANGAELSASTFGTGDAGNVDIIAHDQVVFDGTSAAFSNVEAGAEGQGGNVQITTGSLTVTNGAQLIANTFGTGSAGNVNIVARDQVVFDGVSADGQFNSAASSNVEAGAEGQGGNVQITTGSLTVTNGAQLIANTSGTGSAGNVNIVARDQVLLQGSDSQGLPSGLLTNNTETSSGQASDITITAPRLLVQEGAVIIASTVNNQPGGNIVLALGRLAVLSGGQVVTGSLGSGPAGTIQLDATSGIVISGSDPTFAARAAQNAGVALLAIPQSRLSVRSEAGGAAGNIIIGELGTTPRLELNDGGQITAESAAVDGGNISLNLNTLLLLRRGGLISTTAGTAQAGGNGGNITITVPFIVAIPSENSDIAADAFAGAGGNIRITARGIFGIEPRPQHTPLSDITASSELGITGSVVLNTLDTGFIQNSLAALQDLVTDPDSLILGSCIARQDEGLGSFLVTGNGGLPHRPGDPGISTYPTGVVRSSLESTAFTEADGVYQLPDGRLVLSHACR
jgi:filamentous hemagglutinin family protein